MTFVPEILLNRKLLERKEQIFIQTDFVSTPIASCKTWRLFSKDQY